MNSTHLCKCQAGFIAHAQDRFSFPAANLPGYKIGDLVTFREFIPPVPGQSMRGFYTGKEASFEIIKVLPTSPDGSRVPFLLVERVK